MKTIDRFVKQAREYRSRARKFLVFAILYSFATVPLVKLIQGMELSPGLATMVVLLAILVPAIIAGRWAYAPLRSIRCPKCGTHLGKRLPVKDKLDPKKLVNSPEHYKICRSCSVDFSDLEYSV